MRGGSREWGEDWGAVLGSPGYPALLGCDDQERGSSCLLRMLRSCMHTACLCPAASASQGGLPLFPGTSQETKQAREAKKIPPSALLCEQRARVSWTQ